jgi:hypothetical protein
MDADRSGDQMTESAVDRELQAMLAVDPSPEFVARVRTRIASEPEPTAWWLSWKFAVGVAMAAVVVLAVVMARSREAVRSQPGERREATTDITRPTVSATAKAQEPYGAQEQNVASAFPPALATSPGELRRDRAEARSAKAGRQTSGATSPSTAGHHVRTAYAGTVMPLEQGVLIDPRESSALRALIAGVRAGRVDLEPALHAAAPVPAELPAVAAIAIAPITIQPLVFEEGVRQ